MNDENPERPPVRTDETRHAEKPGFNLDESPLAWLARRKDKDGKPMLSEAEIAAGEKLRTDFWFAQMTPRVTANWSMLLSETGSRRGAPDQGAEVADSVIAARERVRLALKAAGPELAGVLIDVCCHLKGLEVSEKSYGWPQRSAKVVLVIALRHLARHYGYISDPAQAARRPGRISHWGSADYRPRGDVEEE